MKLNEAIEKTKKVANKMPGPKWGIYQRFAELNEEVGELANAIQTKEGYKTAARKKSEVVDSVCDVLYEILLIAAIYNIDLDTEYEKVLKAIDARRAEGEFDPV